MITRSGLIVGQREWVRVFIRVVLFGCLLVVTALFKGLIVALVGVLRVLGMIHGNLLWRLIELLLPYLHQHWLRLLLGELSEVSLI